MPTLVGPIDQLDRFLNRRILSAITPVHVRRWWAIKMRAKRLLAQSPQPRALAVRILRVLETRDVSARAA